MWRHANPQLLQQAEHHGKRASPGYLIVTSGILGFQLEDVMSDQSRRASLCVGLSGKRRTPASARADFSLECAEIQIYSDADLV